MQSTSFVNIRMVSPLDIYIWTAELNAQFEAHLDLGHLYPTLPPLLSDPAQAAPHYLIVLNVCLRSQRRTQLAT